MHGTVNDVNDSAPMLVRSTTGVLRPGMHFPAGRLDVASVRSAPELMLDFLCRLEARCFSGAGKATTFKVLRPALASQI